MKWDKQTGNFVSLGTCLELRGDKLQYVTAHSIAINNILQYLDNVNIMT